MKNTTVQQWTKEIPTEDGWYWVKLDGDKFIVKFNGWSDHSKVNNSNYEYEFYGPIEEPK